MSIKVQSYVWEHSKQKHGSLLVLLAIADFADDQGRAFPSVDTLAKKARLTERQAQRVLKQLEADGEIAIGTNQGPYGCNLYTVKMTGRQNVGGDIKRTKGVTFATENVEKMSPEPSLEPSVEPPIKNKKVSGKPTHAPQGFIHPEPSDAITQAFTPDEIEQETEQFIDHAKANGKTFIDWDAAWRTWMRNAIKYKRQRNKFQTPKAKSRPVETTQWNGESQLYASGADWKPAPISNEWLAEQWGCSVEEAQRRRENPQHVEHGTAKAA